MSEIDEMMCLDDRGENTCEGEVEYFSLDGLRAWPRCPFHFEQLLERRENSMERYANSDVAPSWFREDDIGETW